MRIRDWCSDVCSSDLRKPHRQRHCWTNSPLNRPTPATGTQPHPVRPEPVEGLFFLLERHCPSGPTSSTALTAASTPATPTTSKPASRHMKQAQSPATRSEEHTSELQTLMRISYAVFCLKKKKNIQSLHHTTTSLPSHLS